MNKILYLNLNENFKQICLDLNLTCCELGKANLNETIHDLLTASEIKTEAIEFPYSFLLMANMSEAEMDNLSQLMKQQGIKNCIKVALTPYNEKWKLVDLLNEVLEEHLTFGCMQKLVKLVKQGDSYQKQQNDPALYSRYEQLLLQSFVCLQNHSNREQMEKMIAQLEECMKELK